MIKEHCCNRAEAPTTPQRAFVFNERRGTRRKVGRVRRMAYETSVAVLSPAQQHRARDGCPQEGASERRGILWRRRGPSGLRWVWRNGSGPHLEGRQASALPRLGAELELRCSAVFPTAGHIRAARHLINLKRRMETNNTLSRCGRLLLPLTLLGPHFPILPTQTNPSL